MKISRLAVISALLMSACIQIPDIEIPDCKELGFNPTICIAEDAGVGVFDAAPDQDGAPSDDGASSDQN